MKQKYDKKKWKEYQKQNRIRKIKNSNVDNLGKIEKDKVIYGGFELIQILLTIW